MGDTWLIHPDNWGTLLRRLFVFDKAQPLLFPTWDFLVLFVLFLGGYLLLADRKPLRVIYILAFSLFFYYKSDGLHFLLLILSTVIDYLLGIMIYAYQLEEVPYREVKIFGKTRRVVDLYRLASYSYTTNGAVETVFPTKGVARYFTNPLRLFGELVLTGLDRGTYWIVAPYREFGRQRLFLIFSVVINLGLLAFYKYTNFLIGSINDLTNGSLSLWDIALPVGISFFTFQTMSYTIDIYRGKLEPLVRLLDFGFFVSFFPQLVAGPIVRASQFLPQIRGNIRVTQEDLGRGLFLICIGLFKKAVISDFIANGFSDQVFEEPALYTGFENLMAVYGYALQIYCDFSGYSDIAIGIGLLLGYQLPINFMAPYQSASVRDFWRRWHISLSTWLRDYLYVSLGGNRKSKIRTYVNLLLTMILGGLWHGASWRFVIWGAMHGVMLALDRMLTDTRHWVRRKLSAWFDRLDQTVVASQEGQGQATGLQEWLVRMRWYMHGWVWLATQAIGHIVGLVFTFHFVCLTWIYFRAESLEKAHDMIRNIWYNFHPEVAGQVLSTYSHIFLLMLLGYILHFIPAEIDRRVEITFARIPVLAQSAVMAFVMYLVLQSQTFNGGMPFIYFQF